MLQATCRLSTLGLLAWGLWLEACGLQPAACDSLFKSFFESSGVCFNIDKRGEDLFYPFIGWISAAFCRISMALVSRLCDSSRFSLFAEWHAHCLGHWIKLQYLFPYPRVRFHFSQRFEEEFPFTVIRFRGGTEIEGELLTSLEARARHFFLSFALSSTSKLTFAIFASLINILCARRRGSCQADYRQY